MADEVKPVVVLKPKPGEHQVTNLAEEVDKAYDGKPPPRPHGRASFEVDLDGRTSRAMEQFKQAHSDMFGPPPNDTPPALPVETTTLDLTPAPTETELPQADENAPEVTAPPPAKAAESPAATEPKPEIPPSGDELKTIREMRAALREAAGRERSLNRQLKKLQEASGSQPTQSPFTPAAPQPASQTPAVAAPQPTPEPISDDDPFGLKAGLKEIEQRLEEKYSVREQDRQRETAEEQQRRYTDDLNRSEKTYQAEQPDYYEAVDHLANWERQRYQLSGQARRDAAMKMNDPQWKPVIERIADEFVFVPDSRREGTLLTVKRDSLTPEQVLVAREMNDAEAAICLSTDLWVRDRRNEILQSNRPEDVPKVVWELATKTAGYQGKPRQAVATTNNNGVTAAKPNATAAERIRQQARVNAASRTTANLSSGMPGSPNGAPQIQSMAELQEFHRRDPAAARRYMEQMSRVDPNWHRNLAPS